jgi:hypothetical protein
MARRSERARLDEEARAALRLDLRREPTSAEVRHLRLGQSALGDNELLRVRTANALKNLRDLRRVKRELLAQLRKNRKQTQAAVARARRVKAARRRKKH